MYVVMYWDIVMLWRC